MGLWSIPAFFCLELNLSVKYFNCSICDTETFWGLDNNSTGSSQALLTLGSPITLLCKGNYNSWVCFRNENGSNHFSGAEGVWVIVTGKHKKFGKQSLKLISPLHEPWLAFSSPEWYGCEGFSPAPRLCLEKWLRMSEWKGEGASDREKLVKLWSKEILATTLFCMGTP